MKQHEGHEWFSFSEDYTYFQTVGEATQLWQTGGGYIDDQLLIDDWQTYQHISGPD